MSKIVGSGIKPPEEVPFRSQAFRRLWETASELAASSQPVLVTGEVGTGKTNLARMLHHGGPRRSQPSCEWRECSPYHENPRLDAFGWVRGVRGLYGLEEFRGTFAECDGGTLLLDPVPYYPREQQRVVAEYLNHSLVWPVGACEPFSVDARVVLVACDGRWKSDRFSSFVPALRKHVRETTLRVPPLRERPEDIRPLFFYHLKKLCQESTPTDRALPVIPDETLRYLESRRLPGNGWDLWQLAIEASVLPVDEGFTVPLLKKLAMRRGLELDVLPWHRFREARRSPLRIRRAVVSQDREARRRYLER